MEVILKQDIMGLGEEGEIRKVAPGYARNYLLPKGLAVMKNTANIKRLEQEMEAIQERRDRKRQESMSLSERLQDVELTLRASAGETEKLFGSITSQDIAAQLVEMGYEIDKRRIELKQPIKILGEYTIRIRLHEQINPEIKVIVRRPEAEEEALEEKRQKEEEERKARAERQAKRRKRRTEKEAEETAQSVAEEGEMGTDNQEPTPAPVPEEIAGAESDSTVIEEQSITSESDDAPSQEADLQTEAEEDVAATEQQVKEDTETK